jgi:transcriptional regulator with XRE-family HTH domain
MNAKGEATAKMEAVGIEQICEWIERGDSQTEIAKRIEVSVGSLSTWLNQDQYSERSARAREKSAESWLDRGFHKLEEALDKSSGIDPSAAKAYAQECARRAAIRNPRYVEKTAHQHSGVLKVAKTDLTDEELAAIAAGSGG